MRAHSTVYIKKAIKIYDGFSSLGSIVDVGGGIATALALIIANYPYINGVNFDLPEVVRNAPTYHGIEHIGGDMFAEVPRGDAISYSSPQTDIHAKYVTKLDVIMSTKLEGKERTKDEFETLATKKAASDLILRNGKPQAREDEEAGALALAACVSHIFPMALDAAIQLDLFEIIARAGVGALLSPSDIAPNNFQPATTEQPPCLIACSGCWPPTLWLPVLLKDAVLEGGNLTQRIHGKSNYELIFSNPETAKVMNDGMKAHSTALMRKTVRVYDGFSSLSSIVDVGGGTGTTLAIIVAKYPYIKGINFDLPHVVRNAPSHNGICFEVPKEMPSYSSPQTDAHAKYASGMDIIMLTHLEGKERTKNEFETLATKAGFVEFKVVCYVYGMWIMELMKSV
ncbi:UNVERIFIED_CONTAM: Bergaptol O-methyltransferase [Sesamum calycinum]|uniref:Bergaptol O-methyltransferase n=1 Tax=Sesamum calycinum TaxID=2727403 RepID=A0AAW2P5W6_9LAMI